MAFLAEITYTATAAQTDFVVPFPFLLSAHVGLEIDGVPSSAFSLSDAVTLVLDVPAVGGEEVRIFRTTPLDAALTSFLGGTPVTKSNMDNFFLQLAYAMEEARDHADAVVVGAGNLPAVTGADNDSWLAVVAGAWAVITLAQARALLGVADNPEGIAITTGFSANNDQSATWKQSASNVVPLQQPLAAEINNGSGDIAVSSGTDEITLTAGKWEIEVNFVFRNDGTVLAQPRLAVTDNVDSAAQVVYGEIVGTQMPHDPGGSPFNVLTMNWRIYATLAATTPLNLRISNNAASGSLDVLQSASGTQHGLSTIRCRRLGL